MELQFRNELKITDYKNDSDFKKDTIVDLYCSSITEKYNLKIGTGIYLTIASDKETYTIPIDYDINNIDI